MEKDILFAPHIDAKDFPAIKAVMGIGLPHSWNQWQAIAEVWPAQHSTFDVRPVRVHPSAFEPFWRTRASRTDVNALLDFAEIIGKGKAPAE